MKDQIKTLANCSEIEFLRQTNRIRKAVQDWLTVTDVLNIRKNVPDLKKVPANASDEDREKILIENKKIQLDQAKKNIDAMLDAALEEHPEETVKIMKLCCFVEADDTSKHIGYYMAAFTEMMGDEDVINFFISLISLARKFGLTA